MILAAGDAIWPPDLSQVIPDTAVSIVTGLIVGAVIGAILWALQLDREHRRALVDADAEWRRRLPAVLSYANASYTWPPQPEELPESVQRLRDLISPLPIPAWRRLLKYPELQSVEQLTTDIARWEAHAIALAARRRLGQPEPPEQEAFNFGMEQVAFTRQLRSLESAAEGAMRREPIVAVTFRERLQERRRRRRNRGD